MLQKSSYSSLSPAFLFTSTTTREGVSSNISAPMVRGPLTPSRVPSMLTRQSFLRTVKLLTFAISSSFFTMSDMGSPDTNLISFPLSSNSPDKLNPFENDMISNALRLAGRGSDPRTLWLSPVDNVPNPMVGEQDQQAPSSARHQTGCRACHPQCKT
ncbi:Os01g0759550 [Oryza sativa Japonica Group]|uniref:Os01g0759550 protein n=1 Tax=Oryza sativa subsp. japonica TaxID=39947 RepID=A0A0N7KDS6_ORYSJ|nr:hypothetical protein EE612_005856 [Oryza sativa]BAS74441.1 Os01g0759550 [Oryza sativa Japonica Group]